MDSSDDGRHAHYVDSSSQETGSYVSGRGGNVEKMYEKDVDNYNETKDYMKAFKGHLDTYSKTPVKNKKSKQDLSENKENKRSVHQKARNEETNLFEGLTDDENDFRKCNQGDAENQASQIKTRSGKRKKLIQRGKDSHDRPIHQRRCRNRSRVTIPHLTWSSDEKDKILWARRAYFMSTEKIFPGFISSHGVTSNRASDPNGVKLRSSIPLKICLMAHAYFLPFWFIAFLTTQEFASEYLKPLHNYVHTCLTYVSMGTDILRLYAGFTSNTKDDMQLMALYWMATAILQTPMMGFIFATHCFATWVLPLNVAVDIILGVILGLEIWFGFWHLKGLVRSEIDLLHMARRMNEVHSLQDREENSHQKVVNCPVRGPYLAKQCSDSESQSDSTNSSERSTGHDGDARKTRNLHQAPSGNSHVDLIQFR